MPIRPENKVRYPADWSAVVVPRIRARSGNRCECTGQCGLIHGGLVERCNAKNGSFGHWEDGVFDDETIQRGRPIKVVRIVLTVMHLDHQPENCDDSNLRHACQRCHLRYDAPMKLKARAERLRAAKASADLFCEEVPK